MARVHVHDIAREYGLDSRKVVRLLSEMGEFVKSASSTVEAPVVARLRERLGEPLPPEQRQKPREPQWQREWRREQEATPQRPPRLPAPRQPSTALDDSFAAAADRIRRSQRGRRHRGSISPMTQVFLDRHFPGSVPPFEDEHQEAERSAAYWLTAGWLTPAEIAEWLDVCPNVTPDAAVALANAGVSPRLARSRLWHGKVMADRPPLYMLLGAGHITRDQALSWLHAAGFLAA